MSDSKVWFVTGASQGLGLILVKKLLDAGCRVAATSRNAQKLNDSIGVRDSKRFLSLSVDLNNVDSISESVQKTIDSFGTIDVVVNNAGYGMMGTVEDTDEEAVKKIFNVNVLASVSVTRIILPIMRKQKSGHIINIGSVAGFVGAPGWSVYSATKAAIAAFSEVLALDVKEFGIGVTVVEPSGFRTGFLTENSLAINAIGVEGYEAVREAQQRYLAGNGKQPGDPEKAAEILITLFQNQSLPLHLYLGEDAYNRTSAKLLAMNLELEKWKDISISADYK